MALKIPPAAFSEQERVAMATRCRDCDPVPKVLDTGQVFELADGWSYQLMHNGLKMLAGGYYGQWMLDLIRLCRGHHETQEERMFHEVVGRLPADATMIELGCFWAYYSVWFLKDRPGRRAIGIEPEPEHLAVGQANAELNGVAPVLMPGFAGATYDPSVGFEGERSGTLQLPRYSVHQLMADQGWDKLTLLHADIQGAETEVLESCRDLFLAGRIGWVFVSTHAHQISGDPLTHQRCLAILRECGAVIEAEHDVHESFSGDGLIVARFGAAPPGWQPVAISHNRASQSLFRHLAFDLAEANAAVAVQPPPPAAVEALHPSLQRRGILLTLRG